MRSAPGPGFCWPRQRSRSPSSAAVLSTTASARCSTWRVLRSGYSVSSSASTCSRPKDSSRLVPRSRGLRTLRRRGVRRPRGAAGARVLEPRDLGGESEGDRPHARIVQIGMPCPSWQRPRVVGGVGATVTTAMPKRPNPVPPAPPPPPPGLYAPESGGTGRDPSRRPADIPPIPPGMYAPETGLIRKVPKKK